MPITQAKHLELLEAAEDYRQALAALEELIARQHSLAEITGNWENLFKELVTMGHSAYLLSRPTKSKLTVELVRAFYSPTRLGINRRAKNAQARRRAKAASRQQNFQENDEERDH